MTVGPRATLRGLPPIPRFSRDLGLLLIAIVKLLKGLLLAAAGFGLLRLLHTDVADTVTMWIGELRLDPDNRLLHPILSKASGMTDRQLEALSVGSFTYAGLLLTEGTGLMLRKRWAEYFTVIVTGSLIPLEVYEIARHATLTRVIVAVLNGAIVWYLIARLRHEGRAQGPCQEPPGS